LTRTVAIAAALQLATATAHADPRMSATAPPAVAVGDRFEVLVVVELGPEADAPILLTPRAEGSAIEAVRGRLLRADAEDPNGTPLRFRVPFVARAEGQAVLHLHVLTYRCTNRCEAIEVEERVEFRVQPSR
jgi:hypothetical protein